MMDTDGELTLVELVLPEQANHYGTLFAPNGLALLGKAAYLVAARFTRQSMVMVGANQIAFKAPIPVGSLVRVTARVTRVGRTSLSASVSAGLDTPPGAPIAAEALRGEFELVAIDERGRPCAITRRPAAGTAAAAAPT